jgi:hypothetical protein
MGVSGPTLVSSSFSSAAIIAVSLSLEKSWQIEYLQEDLKKIAHDYLGLFRFG